MTFSRRRSISGVFIKVSNGCYGIAIIQPDQFHSLRGTSLFTDPGYWHPDGNTTFTSDHQVFFLIYIENAYQMTGLFSYVDGLNTFSSPVGNPVFFNACSFSKSLFAYH